MKKNRKETSGRQHLEWKKIEKKPLEGNSGIKKNRKETSGR